VETLVRAPAHKDRAELAERLVVLDQLAGALLLALLGEDEPDLVPLALPPAS
jgi:hypothetical protein